MVEAVRPSVLLTVPEVAKRLGIGRTHAYSLVRSGQIPAVRLGRRAVRVREADLEAFIESRVTTAAVAS